MQGKRTDNPTNHRVHITVSLLFVFVSRDLVDRLISSETAIYEITRNSTNVVPRQTRLVTMSLPFRD